MVKNPPAKRDSRFDPWVRKISWSRKWQPTPVFLSEKFHGQRSLVGYSPWVARVGLRTHTQRMQRGLLRTEKAIT